MRSLGFFFLVMVLLSSGCSSSNPEKQAQFREKASDSTVQLQASEPVQDEGQSRAPVIGTLPLPSASIWPDTQMLPQMHTPAPLPRAVHQPKPEINPKTKKAKRTPASKIMKQPEIHEKERSVSVNHTQKLRRKELSLVELRRKYSKSFIFSANTARKQLALTFDDAPDTVYTPKVLDILKQRGVKATFFVVGYRAEQYPEIIRRMIREGHVIGNHSYGHSLLKKLTHEQFIREIEKTESVLTPLLGYTPRLIRPPYGAINDDQLSWLSGHGYLTVNWNVDPEDWKGVPAKQVLNGTLEAAAPGSIILMHCATGKGGHLEGTVEALPRIIDQLKKEGFQLVTLPQLLHTPKNK